ncbi:hypothetical protein HEB29_004745 [Streptomyces fulvorobeus]|uniref:Uncharacterized protein n=1 Tax=Streptomyces fulvorobeus TaxID=284028 RepID=A0A7Y9HGP4_9ACTN|nr:hypothetical protein [Streptomyces fulvorobeus]
MTGPLPRWSWRGARRRECWAIVVCVAAASFGQGRQE